MSEGIENIGRRDVVWSYAATIFTIGAGVILLPFILYKLPSETVGIWNVFQTITALVFLLDFGFRPSFSRNISYIFSGVRTLKKEGVEGVSQYESHTTDYALLKGTIAAMKRFYRWMALGVLTILLLGGSIYFYFILKKYNGNHTDAMVAWVLLILINSYNLYTFYYDALLTGKGYVKRMQQITIIGQTVYLLLTIILIYAGFGLIAIVSAQTVSVIIRRTLAYKVFFTKEMKTELSAVEGCPEKDIMKAIYPNAIKVGLTQLGGFCVNKSALLIGAAYLPLNIIASYGITVQVIDIIGRCGTVMYQSYIPKLAQCRAEKNLAELKRLYKYCILSLLIVIAVGGTAFVLWGDWALQLIHSDTTFLPAQMLCVMLIIYFLEHNHSVSAGFIMADNKIPFFIPSLISGAATIILLCFFLSVCDMGIWGMILAPGIAQLAYQNWKWPSVVIKELKNTRTK